MRRCLGAPHGSCRTLIKDGSYCAPCTVRMYGQRIHEARQVRRRARVCAICGEGPRPNDPWQADHVIPGHPDSILRAVHRSCNTRRRAVRGRRR